MMKILLLSRYDNLGASSRYRSYQFLPFMQNNGIEVTIIPLLDDDYLLSKYAGKSVLLKIIRAYIKRLVKILDVVKYDLIWIEYELFPLLPAWFEKTINKKVPYIVDYDDAIFHRYDRHPNPIIKKLLGNKIDQVMASAALVTAGNTYLAQRAIESGAKRVEILPTVIDLDRYPPPPTYSERASTIGWIGSPTTTKHFQTIESALQTISQKQDIQIVAIGANQIDRKSTRLNSSHRNTSRMPSSA